MSWDESDEATWERWERQRAARQALRALADALHTYCVNWSFEEDWTTDRDRGAPCRFCGFDDHNERDCVEG